MVYILFKVRACVRKGSGWRGGETTLKNEGVSKFWFSALRAEI